MENGFVVISINTQKCGYYIFSKFDLAKIPQFNANHALSDFKVYKQKKSAEKTANRIREYYTDYYGKKLPYIITKVVSLQEWETHKDCEEMEKFLLSA